MSGGLARAMTEPRAEVSPQGAWLLLSCMEQARKQWKQNGSAPPPGFDEMYDVLAPVAIAAGGKPIPIRHAQPAEATSAFTNPITATQAAYLLGITPRGVRDLCARGVFETARRRQAGWLIERAEVVARAAAAAEA